MIRFLLVVIFLFMFLILGIPVLLVLWLVGKSRPGLKDRASSSAGRFDVSPFSPAQKSL